MKMENFLKNKKVGMEKGERERNALDFALKFI
jgi:hypothetical protein